MLRQSVQLLKIKVTSSRDMGWSRGRAWPRQMGVGWGTKMLTHHQGPPTCTERERERERECVYVCVHTCACMHTERWGPLFHQGNEKRPLELSSGHIIQVTHVTQFFNMDNKKRTGAINFNKFFIQVRLRHVEVPGSGIETAPQR